MLTKPEYGWTDFCLEGISKYGLSYLTNIPYDWLENAIYGLENNTPFAVTGYLEPGICNIMVTDNNCYIIVEDEFEGYPIDKDIEYVKITMVDFCKNLYKDISENINEWTTFCSYDFDDYEGKEYERQVEKEKKKLEKLLSKLKSLLDNIDA